MSRLLLAAVLSAALVGPAAGALPRHDFADPAERSLWGGPHHLEFDRDDARGLSLRITGDDPYLSGPARDYPEGQALWLRMRLRVTRPGGAQLFWFRAHAREGDSIRFPVATTNWQEARVPLPPLGAGIRLRFDPPGGAGDACVVAGIDFEPRVLLREPAWPMVGPVAVGDDAAPVSAPGLRVRQDRRAFNAFVVEVGGVPFAVSSPSVPVGFLRDGAVSWFDLTRAETSVRVGAGEIVARATVVDPAGGKWQWRRRFEATGGGVRIRTTVGVGETREAVFVPGTLLFAGIGSFGTNKAQAILPGVEYLENEESSSERDIVGPSALRRVPDPAKITFPMAALAAAGRWLGIEWARSDSVSALLDSPDRVFRSGGHVLGLIAPGGGAMVRPDGALLPYAPVRIEPGRTLEFDVTLRGGEGSNVVPAVRAYVRSHPLPPPPATGYTPAGFWRLGAGGWLDSGIRDGARYRHAVGAGFGSGPALDAALWMRWLAPKVDDAALAGRLRVAAAEASALAPAAAPDAQVGHVRWWLPALVTGGVREQLVAIRDRGRAALGTFQAHGSLPFVPRAGVPDLGRTHWEREAGGLAGTQVAQVLRAAAITGDPALRDGGLRVLAALGRWRGGVPRGAQTWEVPLHTPDILASAWLCDAYTLAHEMTGERSHLDDARHWAWTGVPFVYLAAPTPGPVGAYSTIPVLGATHYVAPNWIGLPVQWCGLVYADAVRRLAAHDEPTFWNRLADGIAAAGVQHTHPASEPDRQGLLPDSFDILTGLRNPVPINPATLLPGAVRLFGEPPVQESVARPGRGGFIHAPGPVGEVSEGRGTLRFRLSSWAEGDWRVLVTGVPSYKEVRLDGKGAQTAQVEHTAADGWLVIRPGAARLVQVTY